jgi:hypothetical protein
MTGQAQDPSKARRPEDIRLQLLSAGYTPTPCAGKAPVLKGWQTLLEPTLAEIEFWSRTAPGAQNTGVLTRLTPTLDVDIFDPDAAAAVEDMARDRFAERGPVLARFGRSPKRCVPFRTETPFRKIVVDLVAPDGADAKLELLADGQQFVCHGVHPETGKAYSWFDRPLHEIAHADLPYIHAEEAQALVDDSARLLVETFGYRLKTPKPRPKGNGAEPGPHSTDWSFTADDLIDHARLASLAMKLLKSGMGAGAVVNFLRSAVAGLANVDEERRARRLKEIPGMVESAEAKLDQEKRPVGPPSTLKETLAAFDKWLALESHVPVLAVLAAVAANYLDGDPVWLGVVAPPSSAKTEIIISLSLLPDVVQAATLTAAALLSGTPRKDRDKTAKGGLLRQVGAFGVLTLKDFGSILSMHTETRAELLAALREIADGAWTRHIGVDGGKTLAWKGKLGLIFGVTPAIDAYHGVIGSLGDRWLLTRMAPVKGQFRMALKHRGADTKAMRAELADAVARLFASHRPEPRPISDDEIGRIERAVALVVRLRGAVERDRRTRELDMIYGAEGTGRIGLALERLLAGLDSLGVNRELALKVVESVAMDSVPWQRREAYQRVAGTSKGSMETNDVANALGVPTVTARRVLEDLAAYGLISRESGGAGKADRWTKANWE